MAKKKDYSVKIGFYTLGNVQFKLIEPLSDSIFNDFYDEYGEGVIHHLGMEINDYEDVLGFLKSKGVETIQSGIHSDGIKYSYVSTDSDINFIIEIAEPDIKSFIP